MLKSFSVFFYILCLVCVYVFLCVPHHDVMFNSDKLRSGEGEGQLE